MSTNSDECEAKGELQLIHERLRQLKDGAVSEGNRLESVNYRFFGAGHRVEVSDNEEPKSPDIPDYFFVNNINRSLTILEDALHHIRLNTNKLCAEADNIEPIGEKDNQKKAKVPAAK